MRILLIEDDLDLAERLVARLAPSGFRLEHAASAEAAQEWPNRETLAALIVDLGLPGLSGVELINWWRAQGLGTPILILSARGDWEDKVEGLNSGADDFVVKPARSEEIVARLNALLRRASGRSDPVLHHGELRLDPETKTAWRGDVPLDLTQTEYRLFNLFLLKPGHVLSQGDLLERLYDNPEEHRGNTIEALIARLRRKIGKDAIVSVRGLGYRLQR
jgi:two-component system, OmpR family, response regulator